MFDQMVESRLMPRPKVLGPRRIAWDVRELDSAADNLPTQFGESLCDDGWNDANAS
jgi:predicted DNA-binding transcriptional regulator AlpA